MIDAEQLTPPLCEQVTPGSSARRVCTEQVRATATDITKAGVDNLALRDRPKDPLFVAVCMLKPSSASSRHPR